MTKLLNKLHRFLFYLLILLLPVQLGKHFWPDWALVEGIRIDYLSPTIHLTDILVIGVLVSWGIDKLHNFQFPIINLQSISKFQFSNKKIKRLILLFSFFILNIFLAQNKPVAALKALKIAALFFLAVYVKNNITTRLDSRPPRIDRVETGHARQVKQPALPAGRFNKITILLSFTIIYSSLIAWAQFLKQSSIGGLFWWLGERTFVSSTPGIAQAILNGRLFLRPYATFSHPNVLGGYIAVVLPVLIFNFQFSIFNFQIRLREFLKLLAVVLGITALFISFSRAAWVVGGMGIVVAFFLSYKNKSKEKKQRWLYGYMAIWLIVLLFFGGERLGQLRFNSESFQLRQELNSVALAMIKKHPLTGVGLNNFIPSLPNFKKGLSFKELQPVHNIYLLIAAETGLIGLGAFLWLIYKAYQRLISNDEFLISKQIPNPKTPASTSPLVGRGGQNPKKVLIKSLDTRSYLGQLVIRSIRNLAKVNTMPLFISLTCMLLLGLADHYFFTLQQAQLLLAIVLGMVFGVRLD